MRCAGDTSCNLWRGFVLALSLLPSTIAFGADTDNPQASAPRYLTLDYLDAYLEFEADISRNRVETPGRGRFLSQRSQRNRDRLFEERLGLQLGGSILDPAFINFGGELSFALTQSHFKETIGAFSESDRDGAYLLQYDLRLNFFQGQKVSGSVYGLRRDDRITRRFQPTLRERRSGFGTSWVLFNDKLPMELSYDYTETDRTGNTRKRDDERFTESTLHYGIEWKIDEHEGIKLSYEHAETKQEYQGSRRPFQTTRDLLRIEHRLAFGDGFQNEIRTLIHWQEESGDFARDLFEIGPRLTLHHTDDLQTIYTYQFNKERYEGLGVETHRADFQLIHQMYTNLTTTAGVFALYEDVEDDVQTSQYGASVDWQYNRRNRFGHLYANLALAYDTEDVRGGNGRRLVINEAHAFRDPVPIILRNRNVILAGVVVTDAGNRRIYRRGLDYTVLIHSNVTRIARILTGQIADGDTVLVDYMFRTPARGKLDTIRVDFSLEQRFSNGWTPYYRVSYRNQEDEVSSGFLRRADRTNHHRLGVRYERKKYSLGAELEIFDDSIDPYDAYHLRGLVHLIQSADHTLDASARLSQLFFEGGFDDRDVIMLDLELDHRRRLSESWSTLYRVAYRLENDSSDGRTHAWDVAAGVEYVFGDLSGELTFEYDRLDLPDSQEDDFGLYLRVRREFRDVLARH